MNGAMPPSALVSALTTPQNVTNSREQVEAIFDVTKKLTLRGGFRHEWGDATVRAGVLDQSGTLASGALKRNVGLAGATIRPWRKLSLNVDYEGASTSQNYFRTDNVLIENGVLRGYLQDKLSCTLLGAESTGSGRRESYAYIPMPRMTNTFMMAGESDPEEIIRSVPKGLYCANFGGGQVDITSGNFVFSASESYFIEDGKLTRPVRNATLIGNGPEALKYVSMVGNDLKLDEGIGVCGKDGQSVPVGVGIPTIKIDKMTVGGTA